MENNQPPPETQQPEQPQQAQIPPVVEHPHRSHFGMLFIALFLLGILFLGGTYLFVISQKNTNSPMPIVNEKTQIQKSIHQLQQDLPDADTTESDFTQVDAEMKNL